MKQIRLIFLVPAVIFIVSGARTACAAGDNQAAIDASLSVYEKSLGALTGDPSEGSLPLWKASLSEIQRSSVVLLETNSKLSEESREVKRLLDARRAELEALLARNNAITQEIDTLRAKNKDDSDAAQAARFKEILVDRNDQIKAQKQKLAGFDDRVSSTESRLALARLRVQGLEIDRKSMEVNLKARDEAAVAALRSAVAAVRENIARTRRQIDVLREKTLELSKLENPYVTQAKEITARNEELRKRAAALEARRTERQAVLKDMMARRTKAEQNGNIGRVQKLLDERAALEPRLKEASLILEDMRRTQAELQSPEAGLQIADVEKFKKQNASIEEVVANLRENIALLEYKTTTLQRYKGRNASGR